MSRKIRIGCRRYSNFSGYKDPEISGYTKISISEVSPYSSFKIKNQKGEILENVWTFSAVYNNIPEAKLLYSTQNKREIWNHPGETHYVPETNYITENYWNWRLSGFASPFPITYHNLDHKNSFFYLKQVGFSSYLELDYNRAKKEIFLDGYFNNFDKSFLDNLPKGNLLLVDRYCVNDEWLPYFTGKYDLKSDFIFKDTIQVDKDSMDILINDNEVPICSAYALAILLTGIQHYFIL
jgi:hypothetical protein